MYKPTITMQRTSSPFSRAAGTPADTLMTDRERPTRNGIVYDAANRRADIVSMKAGGKKKHLSASETYSGSKA